MASFNPEKNFESKVELEEEIKSNDFEDLKLMEEKDFGKKLSEDKIKSNKEELEEKIKNIRESLGI